MNRIHSQSSTKVDLNLFRVMLAIVEEGSTVAAANKLNLSQSAISHALRRLRDMMNDPIFIKHGRLLVLTPYAKSILPTVQQSIANLTDCSAKTLQFDPVETQMQFSLGFRDILEFLILPDLLAPLRQQKSQLRINSQRLALGSLEEKLLSGELDVVIDLESPTSTKIESEEIICEPLCILAGRGHPCFTNKNLTVADYSSSDHVLVSLNRRERAYVDNRIKTAGVKRDVVLKCEHYLPAARTVEATDLLLTMPYSYAIYLADFLDVKIFELPFECDPVPIRMYWRAETSAEPYMQWILQQLKIITQQAFPTK